MTKNEDVGITFLGTFFKASTLIDGGWRISFDIDSEQAAKVVQLSTLKDSLLQFAIIPIEARAAKQETRGPW